MKIATPSTLPAAPVQTDLFDRRQMVKIGARDTDTSRAAAEAVAPTIGKNLNIVLQAIRESGARGLTADEASERTNLSPFNTRPRCTDLARSYKLIRDSGLRRINTSGNEMIVWIAVDLVVDNKITRG